MSTTSLSIYSASATSWGALAMTLAPATVGSQIGFDNSLSASFGSSVSSFTVAYPVGAASNYLLVGVVSQNVTDVLTTVTYSAVGMTRLGGYYAAAISCWLYWYGLANPATGSHNVVLTTSGSVAILGCEVASYTNLSATQPDSTVTVNVVNSALVWTLLTPTKAGCWGVQFSRNVLGTISSTTGGIVRVSETSDGLASILDTNGVIPFPTPVTLTSNAIGWFIERVDLHASLAEK